MVVWLVLGREGAVCVGSAEDSGGGVVGGGVEAAEDTVVVDLAD
jgi:hypothetical protein